MLGRAIFRAVYCAFKKHWCFLILICFDLFFSVHHQKILGHATMTDVYVISAIHMLQFCLFFWCQYTTFFEKVLGRSSIRAMWEICQMRLFSFLNDCQFFFPSQYMTFFKIVGTCYYQSCVYAFRNAHLCIFIFGFLQFMTFFKNSGTCYYQSCECVISETRIIVFSFFFFFQYTTFFKNAGTCYYQSIGKELGNIQQHRKNLKRVWGERNYKEQYVFPQKSLTYLLANAPSRVFLWKYIRTFCNFRQLLKNPKRVWGERKCTACVMYMALLREFILLFCGNV